MQSRVRYVFYNTVHDAWLNRMADDLTVNMFSALWFGRKEEAQRWLEGSYGSQISDRHNFIIQRTITTIEGVEDAEHLPKTH